MKYFLGALLCVLMIAVCSKAGSQKNTDPSSCCAVVEQALKDAYSLKTGMKRSDVEKFFIQAGGMNFPTTTAYVYKECRYIHLEVTYDIHPVGNVPLGFGASDPIKSVSKLTIDYEAMD